MNPKISIIVPVYNTEKYLDRCIYSILSQTYTNFELLLIDDGSTDSSGAKCDKYAEQDSRVRVFHKANGGVSSARNMGLDNAKGEWICFVDSDDWIELQAMSILSKNADSDLVIASMKFEQSGHIGNFPVLGKIEYKRLFDLLSDNIDHYSVSSPCSKFYKRNIIQENQIRFHENLCFGEDSLFVKKYLLNVDSMICVKDLYYHYQDIGDDIYHKYSKSFKPVLLYYYEMLNIYNRFERLKKVSISRHTIVGVVFNIANICLYKNGLTDVKYVKKFLFDQYACNELYKRTSANIKIMLLLSRLPKGYLLIGYTKLINGIKSLLRLN